MAIRISGVNIIDDGFNILNLSKISAGGTYGTSGQVLTSGGPSANVSWAASASTGRLLRAPQVLTSGTSYTTPAGCTGIYVEAVGGGGGGGTSSGTFNNPSAGSGGGSGAYCAKYFTVTASTAYAYAIGAGGTGGQPGGNTTFTVGGTTINAGLGAGSATAGSTGLVVSQGGVALNGDLNVRGNAGGVGHGNSTTPAHGGHGGPSFFGGGGKGGNGSESGQNGTLGGGGGGDADSSSSSFTGGTGGAGVIRIWEFA